MSQSGQNDYSEETLLAYLDGELGDPERAAVSELLERDAKARARLETLKRGGRPFSEAFDVLLDAAPDAKLQAMFDELLAAARRRIALGFGFGARYGGG
ncbi:MAG: hypothetical protein HC850_10895 [Rhodomicrobium sp.]|nr:hypothetical protein [Rhodomicrobium sp.]